MKCSPRPEDQVAMQCNHLIIHSSLIEFIKYVYSCGCRWSACANTIWKLGLCTWVNEVSGNPGIYIIGWVA